MMTALRVPRSSHCIEPFKDSLSSNHIFVNQQKGIDYSA